MMVKLKGLMFLVLVLVAVTGCTSNDPALEDLPAPEATRNPSQDMKQSTAPADPDPTSDVIGLHGYVQNLYKLDKFIQEKNAVQRIVLYTIEGDPIFYTLEYTKEGSIHVQYDTRKDHFGSKEVLNYTCSSLDRTEADNRLAYELTDCKDGYSESGKISLIQLDYQRFNKGKPFDFRFEYGVNNNILILIDTREQKLDVKVSSDVNKSVSDFQLREKDMKLIYKEAVNQGLLWDQDNNEETVTCNKKPHESYKLTLYKDDNTYPYEWNECDKNNQNLTILKNAIMGVLQKDKIYEKITEDMLYVE